MALFNEIGRKISGAGHSAIQKAKDMADIAKINSQITDAEKGLETTYAQIGRLYVSLHRSDAEQGFAALVGVVTEAEGKINELRRQIMDIRHLVKCPSCGGEVAADSLYCENCGGEMPRKKEMENMRLCDGCGKIIPVDGKFCSHCGKPVPEESSEPSAAQPVAEPEICSGCGAELEADARFCSRCGMACGTAEETDQETF